MRRGLRSVARPVVVGVLVAVIATGCSAQDSRSALGSDGEQGDATSSEAVEPVLSPSPSVSAGDQPVGTETDPAFERSEPSQSASESTSDSASASVGLSLGSRGERLLGASPFELFSFGMEIFEMIHGGTADSLREISGKLDQLSSQVEASRAENRQLLANVQAELNRQGMEATMRSFTSLDNNGDLGLQAWRAILNCRIAQRSNQSTCLDINGTSRPAEESIRRARDVLIDIVDVRWANVDLPTLAGTFTGGGQARGLAQASWNYLRLRQNEAADVPSASAIRRGDKMPVITPELASSTTATLEYYRYLLGQYAFLRSVAVIEKTPEQNKCSIVETIGEWIGIRACQQRILEQMAAEAQTFVFGSGPRSVNRVISDYRLPNLPKNSIAVAYRDGTRRIFYGPKGPDQGAGQPSDFDMRVITPDDVNELGRALETYSSVEKVWRAYPLSFPCVNSSPGEISHLCFYEVPTRVGRFDEVRGAWGSGVKAGWEPLRDGSRTFFSKFGVTLKPQTCITGMKPASQEFATVPLDSQVRFQVEGNLNPDPRWSKTSWPGAVSCPAGTERQTEGPKVTEMDQIFYQMWKDFGTPYVWPRWCNGGCGLGRFDEPDQVSVLPSSSSTEYPLFGW